MLTCSTLQLWDPTCDHQLSVNNKVLSLIQVLNLTQFMLQSSPVI